VITLFVFLRSYLIFKEKTGKKAVNLSRVVTAQADRLKEKTPACAAGLPTAPAGQAGAAGRLAGKFVMD
jgi:hypothetical protein